ncbi:D-2-hydroxyacid dehydrogenase [Kamptonema cortianum]|nr:D-2-hydroxyacid dehydrogenase [Kamptonema cortianum]MDL5050046.1 D-2-hydroxyacid dehydrogenase [Oscillatoria amoena NRMC-F 0135]
MTKPRAVILDTKPLDQDNISWDSLSEWVDLTLHDYTRPAEVAGRIRQAQIVLTNKVRLTAEHMAEAQDLKFISVLATGYDCVDIAGARAKGITVSNVPSYSTASTAQMAIALMLELAQAVGRHSRLVAEGEWVKCPYYSFWRTPLIELEGKTLCIVGLGAIGKRVAQIASALGMNVIVAQLPGRPGRTDCGWPALPIEQAFGEADFLSLHCPLTPETKFLINDKSIAWLKPGCRVVNTARGALIDESALTRALKDGRVAAAAADVLGGEPPVPANPLLHAPNCIVTPHIAWATVEARRKLLEITVENVRRFLQGAPINVVN